MSDIVPGIRTIDELRSFVQATLCQKENLLLEQSKLRQAPLVKQGKICGFQFSVQGPRQVRLGAVWASDRNDIYFYDTRGNRYHRKTDLGSVPMPISLGRRGRADREPCGVHPRVATRTAQSRGSRSGQVGEVA